MFAAFFFSSIFLVSYLTNFTLHGETRFNRPQPLVALLLELLASHILLSIVALPMILNHVLPLAHRPIPRPPQTRPLHLPHLALCLGHGRSRVRDASGAALGHIRIFFDLSLALLFVIPAGNLLLFCLLSLPLSVPTFCHARRESASLIATPPRKLLECRCNPTPAPFSAPAPASSPPGHLRHPDLRRLRRHHSPPGSAHQRRLAALMLAMGCPAYRNPHPHPWHREVLRRPQEVAAP